MTGWARPTAAALLALTLAVGCGRTARGPAPSPGPTPHPAVAHGPSGPEAASFISADVGWALTPGPCSACVRISQTNDGGRHWHTLVASLPILASARSQAGELVDLDFVDARHGYLYLGSACRVGCVFTTQDGGRTWQSTDLPPIARIVNGAGVVYALTSYPPNRAPRLLRNVTGRGAWTDVAMPTADTDPGPSVAAEGDRVAVVLPGHVYGIGGPGPLGQLWVSLDRGGHWAARANPCTPQDGAATVVGLAPGQPAALLIDCYDGEQSSQEQQTEHRLYRSTDDGRHWIRLGDPANTGSPQQLIADEGAGHILLVTLGGAGFDLHASVDGGATWRVALTAGQGGFNVGDVRLVGGGVGFAVGPLRAPPQHLYRTEDGGQSWGWYGQPI